MAKSTTALKHRKHDRPAKPYGGFPLFPHASGRWAKKIKLPHQGQKTHYFGRWGHKVGDRIVPLDDVAASARSALEEFNRQWPFISEGKTAPESGREQPDVCTLKSLCNAFWRSKRAKLLAGELSQRSFADYERTTDQLIKFFGKDRRVDDLRPDDFQSLRSALVERLGPVALRNEINRARVVFKFAHDQRLIERPVHFGQSFNRPTAKALRRSRNEAGRRMFEADDLRTLLDTLDGKPITVEGKDELVQRPADPVFKAMILLGLNGGLGNTDVASLPQSALNLKTGWLEFPRPKTEIERRIPLWPETVAAINVAIAMRPRAGAPELRDLCFLTRTGEKFVRVQPQVKNADKIQHLDSLTQKFAKLLKSLKINVRRGLGFYTLRHVFETIGGESRDQVAVNAIMGHVDSSMAGQYRERISDERLRAVVETVRKWLWPVTEPVAPVSN